MGTSLAVSPAMGISTDRSARRLQNRAVAATLALGAVLFTVFVVLMLADGPTSFFSENAALEPVDDLSWSVETAAPEIFTNGEIPIARAVPGQAICEYSIVAGGVQSAADVDRAVKADPVVSQHYARIAIDKLTPTRVAASRQAYVSYRIGDQVFWSSNTVTLPEGEAVLTDGATMIHARCGSLISDGAATPTRQAEPVLSAYGSSTDTPMVDRPEASAGMLVRAGAATAMTTGGAPARRSPQGVGGGGGVGAMAGGPGGSPASNDTARGSLGADFDSRRLSIAPGEGDGLEKGGPSQAPVAPPAFSAAGGAGVTGAPGQERSAPGQEGSAPGLEADAPELAVVPPTRLEGLPSIDVIPSDPAVAEMFGVLPDDLGLTESPDQALVNTLAGGEAALMQEQAPAEVVPVPEPASLVLFGSGLALTAWRIRRRSTHRP
jgi:hypothetical protein